MKKRILALFMALAMVFGLNTTVLASSLPSGDLTLDNTLTIPTEISLEWSKSSPGSIKINHVSADVDNVWYKLSLYRDGELVKKNVATCVWNKTSGTDTVEEIELVDYVVESGKYYVEVEAQYRYFDANGDIDSSRTKVVTGTSDVFDYVNPGKLSVPGNISLDEAGIYTFDMVENASYYMVMFCAEYAKDTIDDAYMYGTMLTSEDSQDGKTISCDVSYFIKRIQVENEQFGNDFEIDYSVKVMAFTDNIVVARDSDWSEGILVYEYRFSDEVANEKINAAFENDSATDVKTALTSTASDTLAEKVVSDATFATNLKATDEKYKELVDYKEPVSNTDLVDINKVSVVGAAMNGESGDKVQLTFAASTETFDKSDEYKNAVALDIKLLVNDVAVKDLAIPVMITMAVPTGVATDNLVILHYHETGKEPEVITPVVNADGTMTFAVAGFSKFVVANSVIDQENTPVQPEGTPGQSEGIPVQPEGAPVQPEGTPGQPEGTPVQPEGTLAVQPDNAQVTSPVTSDASVVGYVMTLLVAGIVLMLRKKSLR